MLLDSLASAWHKSSNHSTALGMESAKWKQVGQIVAAVCHFHQPDKHAKCFLAGDRDSQNHQHCSAAQCIACNMSDLLRVQSSV